MGEVKSKNNLDSINNYNSIRNVLLVILIIILIFFASDLDYFNNFYEKKYTSYLIILTLTSAL